MHLPSIYVQKVIQGPSYEKRIERVTLAQVTLLPIKREFLSPFLAQTTESSKELSPAARMREKIVRRAACEFKDGM